MNVSPNNHFKMKQSREADQSSYDELSKKDTKNPFSFDEILQEIGEFGLYHILVSVSIGFVLLLTACTIFNLIFSSEIPDHR